MNLPAENTNPIEGRIFTVRGERVMLDSDLAAVYEVTTKALNQAVNRNERRFPPKFCFQLQENEWDALRSQIVTSNKKLNSKNNFRGGRQYLPYVFTEQGIAMLAPLLENDIAVEVSINIMDAFVEMRKFMMSNAPILERLTNVEYKLLEHDENFDKLFNALQKDENFKQKIFFEGQIYDAYSLIMDIIKQAKNKIVIIDNYIEDSILKMLVKKNKNVEVVILTSEKSNILKLDIQKFNKEYPILKVAETNKFHDRFIVLDNTELYHIGASIKDVGKKCFGISQIEDESIIEKIVNT